MQTIQEKRAYNRAYWIKRYDEQRKKLLAYQYRYYHLNRDKVLKRSAKYRATHRTPADMERKRLVWRRWYARSREKRRAVSREYTKKNPLRMKLIRQRHLQKCPMTRVKGLFRHRVRQALKAQKVRKDNKVLDLLGVESFDIVKFYLERQFKPGMSWENYGKWHVDHKIPLKSFDLSKLLEQKKAFHFTNLQPLWAVENLSKGSRIL